jgi:outer membrane protein TolC
MGMPPLRSPRCAAVAGAALSLWLLGPSALHAQQVLTLQQAIDMAQRQGLQARAAASSRDAARQRDRAFNARLLPQVSLGATLPEYAREITAVLQDSGDTRFVPLQQTRQSLGLTVSQKLPFTGGDFFVQSSLQKLQVSGRDGQRPWSSTPLSVGIIQRIFRPNTLRWDSREREIQYTLSERTYLESREEIAIRTTTAFFDLYQARSSLQNATTNVAVNDTLYTLNKGRYEVGKIGENDLLQSELALLRARTSLDGAKLDYDRALATLRLALNVEPGTPLEIAVPSNVPQFEADTVLAVSQALRNRAQVTELELQDVQARRRITEARLNNSFGATVRASVGFNQTGSQVDEVYRSLLNAQRFSLAVEMPLIQWGAHRADVQAAQADRDRVVSLSRATREQTAQDAHFGALQLAQSRRQLALSAKGDTVAAKRFEVAYNRYVIGKIGIDNLYLAQNEKDQALQQFVQSLRSYWLAYYQLRRITLYDFAEGKAIR